MLKLYKARLELSFFFFFLLILYGFGSCFSSTPLSILILPCSRFFFFQTQILFQRQRPTSRFWVFDAQDFHGYLHCSRFSKPKFSFKDRDPLQDSVFLMLKVFMESLLIISPCSRFLFLKPKFSFKDRVPLQGSRFWLFDAQGFKVIFSLFRWYNGR